MAFLVAFLRAALPDLPGQAVTGDLVGRDPGSTTVYLEHAGGHRAVRHRMDRAEIEYSIYAAQRESAAALAHRVRSILLDQLPGEAVDGALVLDAADIDAVRYLPDDTSREHCYGGEVAVSYIEE
ncbi:hypothetical protein ABT354_11245 [Streptomyces sp. NPDC000594]|uniref:hypothetical protein n=1 Tax=Streptomyces sp. NPDC000594 TaxID=3154261 RepID=UPI00332B1304